MWLPGLHPNRPGAGPYEGEPEEEPEEEHDEPEPYDGEAEGIVFEPMRQARRDRRGNIDHETALGGNVGRLGPINNNTHDRRGLPEWFLEFAEEDMKEELLPRVIELHAIKAVLTFNVVMSKEQDEEDEEGPEYASFKIASSYHVITRNGMLGDHPFEELVAECDTELTEAEMTGSGWAFDMVQSCTLKYVLFDPLQGGCSYLPLPADIQVKNAVFNFQNTDEECFRWSILAAVAMKRSALVQPKDISNMARVAKLKRVDTFDWTACEWPMPLDDRRFGNFEKANPTLSLNVLGLEPDEEGRTHAPFPIYASAQPEAQYGITLLFHYDEEKGFGHYTLVRDLSRLMVHRRRANDNRRSHYCHACLRPFNDEAALARHVTIGDCKKRPTLTRDLLPDPKDATLEFKNLKNMVWHPVTIYADFEATTAKVAEVLPVEMATHKLQKHVAYSFMLLAVHEGKIIRSRLYAGADALKVFHATLCMWRNPLMEIVCKNLNMVMDEDDTAAHEAATQCYICEKDFTDENYKVRDHDHQTSKYKGPACNECNLKRKITKQIPIFFHNLTKYDGHLAIKSLESGNVQGIWKNFEQAISFTDGSYVFRDSLSFLQCSLDKAAFNLPHEKKVLTIASCKRAGYSAEQVDLLLRKGIFPYDWMDDVAKLEATELPPIEAFHNHLDDKPCGVEEYARAQRVWDVFGCRTFRDYHDLYLKVDVHLLADVFENFRHVAYKSYGLDPVHYHTLPGYAWDSMLRMTGVELELLTDVDMYLFFEKGIRGGVSSIMLRHAQANNPYMKGYDPVQPTTYMPYVDANNLYGWAMSQKLPFGGFHWVEPEAFDWRGFDAGGEKGAMLEVDLQYPAHLHDEHSDYPLAPERLEVKREMLSPLQRQWLEQTGRKLLDTKKLIPNLRDKFNYVVDIRALQFYVSKGMVVAKVHRVMTFNQRAWLKPFIDFNTNLRQHATNEAERDVYKLMNNSCFGKTMENVRERCDIRLVNKKFHKHTGRLNTNHLRKLTSSPLLKAQRIINENLVAVQMQKVTCKLNKPIYVGTAVLDLSKLLMYQFHYDYMRPRYGNDARLMFTDTDSLAYSVKTEDIFADMLERPDLFDFSKYPKDMVTLDGRPMHNGANGDVPGKFKDELKGSVMTEFVGNRAKSYAYAKESPAHVMAEVKRLKGIKRSVVESKIELADFRRCVLQGLAMSATQRGFRSFDHTIYTLQQRKSALSQYDDKRWICADGVQTLAHGHYRAVEG